MLQDLPLDTLGGIGVHLYFACWILLIVSHIWLFLIVWGGNPIAALLCLILPCLFLFFIRDHWKLARLPALIWAGGAVGMIPAAILMYLASHGS